MNTLHNPFQTLSSFSAGERDYVYYSLQGLERAGLTEVARLPYSLRVLLESVLRNGDGTETAADHIRRIAAWDGKGAGDVPYRPARVILQDFTGVPAVVDLASMRQAMDAMGGDPKSINPEVPVDLIIDHSLQVDCSGSQQALECNMDKEFERNQERYTLLRWAQDAFSGFRVIPPGVGIIHQVNLEFLADVVCQKRVGDQLIAYPDTLVGTDSHTTMINGIGVLGWGVGGIEAEAGMLGQPSHIPIPEVIGVRLRGEFPEGTNATDLALLITEILRKKQVVGKFVEFFGPALGTMSLGDRATVANMAPEYGATCGFFPVDQEVLNYLRLTGRSEEQVGLVEAYCCANQLFWSPEAPTPQYTEVVDVDLGSLTPSLAGPKRPQDRISLAAMKQEFPRGLERAQIESDPDGLIVEHDNGKVSQLQTGAVVIASITSCTNTSNPAVMLGAGLLAKKALEQGLTAKPYVKTSLAPGSRVVTRYLKEAGLLDPLEQLGFHVVGYGCATCIGNGGPLLPEVEEVLADSSLAVASVLSGNRNFEGRIHQLVKANYLASPALVVAYAIAGTMDIDLTKEPVGINATGQPVFLHDIWPSQKEVSNAMETVLSPKSFATEYENVYSVNPLWNTLQAAQGSLYQWDPASTYIRNPSFFQGLAPDAEPISSLQGLRVLGKFGDSVTTDHISPAGAIAVDSPAGEYLQKHGVAPTDFNSYGSRRGNHEVMIRGTFANVRLRNELAQGREGGYTTYWPNKELMTIYDAAMAYSKTGTGLVVLAGKDYGMGSSRDWAAKGTVLLGIKAVIAESFERIHRSNLVMMGVLPLQFAPGDDAGGLGLTGEEELSIALDDQVQPGQLLEIMAKGANGQEQTFQAVVRLDSEAELAYYRNRGILQMVLRRKQK